MNKVDLSRITYAKFASPGRWIGIAYFIFPKGLVERALEHYDNDIIDSPLLYLDMFLSATLSDWRRANPKMSYPTTQRVWDGTLGTIIDLFSDKTIDEQIAHIKEFESWLLPQQQERLKKILASYEIAKESDKNPI